MNTDDLIDRLAADLRPVQRLAPPLRARARGWIGFARAGGRRLRRRCSARGTT